MLRQKTENFILLLFIQVRVFEIDNFGTSGRFNAIFTTSDRSRGMLLFI
jgi:hypothetical protein